MINKCDHPDYVACPVCDVDSGPSISDIALASAVKALGWRCPVCGRGLAPHVSECFHGIETHQDYMKKQFSTPPPEA